MSLFANSVQRVSNEMPGWHMTIACAKGLLLASFCTMSAGAATKDGALGRDDVMWLERVTYGLDSATVARFRELGRRRFLAEQLEAKNDTLPASIQAQIDQFDIMREPAAQLVVTALAEYARIDKLSNEDAKRDALKARNEVAYRIGFEAPARELLRAIYSPAQLKEQMTWFWLNHFNVFVPKDYVRLTAGDFTERAIRPRALGHFRDLVMATLKHPAMLQYLDNSQNAADHVNENYARELMELHTLGVNSGYTQSDVQELARVLSGVGIDTNHDPPKLKPEWQKLLVRDGLFEFNPARHDFGDRMLLGQRIRGGGFAEIEQAIDILVKQPACARFISWKLATYFVADDPPAKLVDAMARTFQHSDGDIAQVLRTMFESSEFAASLGRKFKDPMQYVVSAVRLAYDGDPIANVRPVVVWLNDQNEGLYAHVTPDGYALRESAWGSSGQMSRRFEIARAIGNGNAGLFNSENGAAAKTTGFPRLSSRLYYDCIEPYLSKTTLSALEQATSQQEWNTFLLASPEFNYR